MLYCDCALVILVVRILTIGPLKKITRTFVLEKFRESTQFVVRWPPLQLLQCTINIICDKVKI